MGEEPNPTTARKPGPLSIIKSSLERRLFRTIIVEGLCIEVGYIAENQGHILPSYSTVIRFVTANAKFGVSTGVVLMGHKDSIRVPLKPMPVLTPNLAIVETRRINPCPPAGKLTLKYTGKQRNQNGGAWFSSTYIIS